jgi:hypothetical protein
MIISGSRLKVFRHGWAIIIGNFGVGHYFRRIGMTDEAIAACGLRAPVRMLFGIGTYPSCTKCRRKNSAPTDVRTCVDG